MKDEAQRHICSIFGVDEDAIYWRNRIKRKKIEQYEKLGHDGEFFTVMNMALSSLLTLSTTSIPASF